MQLEEGFLYHIYNQSNSKNTIFRSDSDYSYFIEKMTKWFSPNCDLIAFCLMPNHYHFLIHANKESVKTKQLGAITSNKLSNGLRVTQSQYAQFFNNKYETSGSLFRPKPKYKCLNDGSSDYALTCFIYILQNPVKAGLCDDVFQWKFSSAYSQRAKSKETLLRRNLINQFIGIDEKIIHQELKALLPEYKSKRLL